MKQSAKKTSKHIGHFYIAGFSYYEGALIFSSLKIGTKVKLKPEPNNRYDENAVAIHAMGHKLGYIPRTDNTIVGKLLQNGYNIFSGVIQQVQPEEHPEQQVRVALFLKKQKKIIE